MPAPHPERPASLVLIADAKAGNLSVLNDALSESGYAVLTALQGKACLERARQHLPDTILLAAEMPDLSGLEVARLLKADPATRHIPLLLISANSVPEFQAAAFQAGVSDCLSSPVAISELLSRIAQQLKNTRHSPHARSALDAFGHASLVADPESGRISWQSPLARELLDRHFKLRIELIPPIVRNWLRSAIASLHKNPGVPLQALKVAHASSRVIFTLHSRASEGEWLLMLHEENDQARIAALQACFPLERTQAEVLYWSAMGKHRSEISEILERPESSIEALLQQLPGKLGVSEVALAIQVAREKLQSLNPA